MTQLALHMIRAELDPAALMRFAARRCLTEIDDDDHGYVLHSWLTGMFGVHAPKPFRLLTDARNARYSVLAYTEQSHHVLLEYAQAFADPLAFSVFKEGSFSSKPMPHKWHAGQQLHLEVLACPTSRKHSKEKDVYLRALDRLGDSAPSRERIYLDWFIRQVEPAVELSNASLRSFARIRLVRRTRVTDGGRRLLAMERPQALFTADARLRDGQGFAGLLRRGVGRHRAFGFGMLLLRPAN